MRSACIDGSFSDYWNELSADEKNSLAKLAECSVLHIRNVARGDKKFSHQMAKKIEKACGYPKEKLRPDIWGDE